MIQLTSLIIVPITLGQLGLGIHGFVDFQHLDPVWRVCLPSPVSQNSQKYLELSKQLSWGFPGRALGYLTSYPGSPMTFDCCLSHQQCTCEASPLQGHLPTTPTLTPRPQLLSSPDHKPLAPSVTVFAYRVFREVFKFIFKFLKFDFGCAGSSLLRGFFSSCGTQVLIAVASILGSTGSRAQGLQ